MTLEDLQHGDSTDTTHAPTGPHRRVATDVLPTEVLIMIFKLLSNDTASDWGYPKLPRPLRWAVVTHVCRAWRAAALVEPLLWTDLNELLSGQARWTEEVFKRSAWAPLSLLVFRKTEGSLKYILEHVQAYPEQLGELYICGDYPDFVNGLVSPASNLQTLALHRFMPFEFPVKFLGDSAPSLQRFKTYNTSISLQNSSWLTNVRMLTLDYGWFSPSNNDTPLTVKSFITFLTTLPYDVPEDMQTSLVPPSDLTPLPIVNLTMKPDESSSIRAAEEFLKSITLKALRNVRIIYSISVFSRQSYDVAFMTSAVNFFDINAGVRPNVLDCDYWNFKFSSADGQPERSLSLPISYLAACLPHISHYDITSLHMRLGSVVDDLILKHSKTIEEITVFGSRGEKDNLATVLSNFKRDEAGSPIYPSLRRLVSDWT